MKTKPRLKEKKGKEKEKGKATEAKGVSDFYMCTMDTSWMQMKEHVRGYSQHLISGSVRIARSENRSPYSVLKREVVESVPY